MKTVQEVLKEVDTEELILAYLERVPISIGLMNRTDDVSAKALLNRAKGQVRDFIERMRTIPIKKSDKPALLFVFETAKEYYTENAYALIHLDEVEKEGLETKTYAYEFCEQAEIAGFYVSDVKRTQSDLVGLMADVLFEASFFGFGQEDLEAEKEELDRRIKEVESPDFVGIPAEKALDDLYAEFGIEKEIRTEEEEIIEKAYWDKMIEYNNFLFKKALKEVIEDLKK